MKYLLCFFSLVFCLSASLASTNTIISPSADRTDLVLGPASCSTSGCHGGAGTTSRQFLIWSQRDVHSRAYATLTSSRAARMGEALKIENPTRDAACTACHAPLQTVAPEFRAANAQIEEGVACASCHGTGETWLRSHTRTDWTHADRVAAGMKDLRNLYGRANSCVACHQNIDPQLVKVGKHPALVFELDGQTVSEPKHWRETAANDGAKAWFVGQAVALREMSSALLHGRSDATLDAPRWAGLLWVLQQCELGDAVPSLKTLAVVPGADSYAATLEASDLAARRAASVTWTNDLTNTLLLKLAASHANFLESTASKIEQARRAERLVLALDRLLAALPPALRGEAANAQLNTLFRLAQSPADFVPAEFARELSAFEQALK